MVAKHQLKNIKSYIKWGFKVIINVNFSSVSSFTLKTMLSNSQKPWKTVTCRPKPTA